MEERKGLAPLECLSTPYNLSKIAPRLAGLSPKYSVIIRLTEKEAISAP
jgi:hypothetical protein